MDTTTARAECDRCECLLVDGEPHVCPLTATDPLISVQTPLSCAECGRVATYVPGERLGLIADVACEADDCTHEANWCDFDLDEGESLVWESGILHVSTPA